MAKGMACPGCGEMTFNKTGTGVRKCSLCDAVSWVKKPSAPGAGRGQE